MRQRNDVARRQSVNQERRESFRAIYGEYRPKAGAGFLPGGAGAGDVENPISHGQIGHDVCGGQNMMALRADPGKARSVIRGAERSAGRVVNSRPAGSDDGCRRGCRATGSERGTWKARAKKRISPAPADRGHRNGRHVGGAVVRRRGNRCDRRGARLRVRNPARAYESTGSPACSARDWCR